MDKPTGLESPVAIAYQRVVAAMQRHGIDPDTVSEEKMSEFVKYALGKERELWDAYCLSKRTRWQRFKDWLKSLFSRQSPK